MSTGKARMTYYILDFMTPTNKKEARNQVSRPHFDFMLYPPTTGVCLQLRLRLLGASKYCYPGAALPLICPGNFCVHWIEAKCVSLPRPERRVPPESQIRRLSPSAHEYRWFGFH